MDGDTIVGDLTGSITPTGYLQTALNGTLISTSGFTGRFPFNGSLSGMISKGGGSGKWDGKNQWGAPFGTWSARHL
jgi:hypothetical protein